MWQRLKSMLAGLSISIVTLVVMFLFLELLTRLFFPQQLVVIRPDLFQPTDGRGYTFLPNIDSTVNMGEGAVRVITDERGYRIGSQQISNSDTDYRILALGDSFVGALQVEYEEIMTTVLQDNMNEMLEEQVQIINSGMDGYDPNHYLAVLRQTPDLDAYDMVIIFVYVGNDILATELDYIPARDNTVRHDLRIPNNLSRGEIIDAVLYPINDFFEVRSHLYVLTKQSTDTLLARLGLTVAYVSPVILESYADSDDWDTTANILDNIDDYVSEFGIPTLFVQIPIDMQVDQQAFDWYTTAFDIDTEAVNLDLPSQILGELAEDRNLLWVDTTDTLQNAYLNGEDNLYGRIHRHFTADGHQIVADYLTPIIVSYIQDGVFSLNQ